MRTQITEYYALDPDDGLTMNLGVNPLLQFGLEETRRQLCTNILNDLAVVNYVPFDSDTIGNPALDVGDILSFSGGQADATKYACITSNSIKIGGRQSIKCVGKNPKLSQAKSKNDKNISGLLAQIEAGKIGIHTFTNASAFTVADVDTKIISIEFATTEAKHPGIITKEEFIKAQKIFRKKRETKRVTKKDYPLWKKVKCGTCGRAMPFKDRIIRGRPYRYFACPHAQVQVGENGCSKEYIREDVLNGVVWESIKALLAAADEVKEQVKQKQQESDQNNTKLVKKLAKLQKDREKCDAERFANVDQFMAGTLDKEVYQSRRADLTRKADRLDAEIAELEAKHHESEVIQDDGVQSALETLDKFSDAIELDQDIVGALIEKVLVYDPRHVEIRWKFSDEVMKLLQG